MLALMLGFARAQEANGLLADVMTSSGDNFTIELHYTSAPRTVAHFMRLASGDQPWLDHATGNIITGFPYYAGTVFQRFSQTGPVRSYLQVGERKDAIGTEGPGYKLRDEIRRSPLNGSLLLSHQAYTVTMANTGPHSSGGQFIITLVDDTEFNDSNSAFGTVRSLYYTYSGSQAVAVSNGRQAVTNIFSTNNQISISSISFRRRGTGATAFDESQHWGELPSMCKVPITSVTHTSTDAILEHPAQAGGYYRAYGTVDLSNWAYIPSFDTYHGLGAGSLEVMPFGHGGLSSLFCRMIGVLYPTTTAPENLFGKTITVGLSTPYAIRFEFSADGTSAAYLRYSDNSVGALEYEYKVTGPYSGELFVTSPGLDEATYTLYFGGKDLGVTTTEVMSAEIQYTGFFPFDSHFTMLP